MSYYFSSYHLVFILMSAVRPSCSRLPSLLSDRFLQVYWSVSAIAWLMAAKLMTSKPPQRSKKCSLASDFGETVDYLEWRLQLCYAKLLHLGCFAIQLKHSTHFVLQLHEAR